MLVFLPNTLNKTTSGYLKGFHKSFQNKEVFFVTSDLVLEQYCVESIGYIGDRNILDNKDNDNIITIFLNRSSEEIIINNKDQGDETILRIFYDISTFKFSYVVNCNHEEYGNIISTLAEALQTEQCKKMSDITKTNLSTSNIDTFSIKLLLILQPLISSMETILHFKIMWVMIIWLLKSLKNEKKITPKIGNVLLAVVFDMVLGLVFLKFLLDYKNHIINITESVAEEIIGNLKCLLLYLMGSPIGLKLNYAFNHTLGTFFFYHINLWRVFLLAIQPLFNTYFKYIIFPSALGFSFQLAMLSDIVSLATFHVYCIYVYAARLLSVQIKGLTSLWRLFIGRKYNPLRRRVDSSDYSPNQLFIGTLGFTVLLFLLPTTAMYYTVFVTFRLAILLISNVLTRTRKFLNCLPMYVVILWLCNSSSLAGTLEISCKKSKMDMYLEAKLKCLPLGESISTFVPDLSIPTPTPLTTNLFHKVLTGSLI